MKRKKVIISISNGAVSIQSEPKRIFEDIEIEVRNYDIPPDWYPLKEDEDGNRYQSIKFLSLGDK